MLNKKIRKITRICIILLVLISTVLMGRYEGLAKSKEVIFNYKNFPDPVIWEELESGYFDSGKKLKNSHLKEIGYLDLDAGKKKINWKGITHFSELSTLIVKESTNKLTLPQLPKLDEFQYYNNKIKSLTLPALPKLEWACVDGKMLTKLDLSKNKNIKRLTVYAPKMKSLDTRIFKKLEILELDGLQLPSLDLSENKKIDSLSIANMKGISLDFSALPNLENLELENTDIETLELTGCKKLKTLSVSRCEGLQRIELKGCGKLKNLTIKKNPSLQEVTVDESSKLTSLTISECKKITNLDHLNLSKLESLEVCDTSVSDLTPDRFPNLGKLVFYKNAQKEFPFQSLKKLYELQGGYENNTKVLDVSMLPKLYSLSWTNGAVETVKFGKKSRFQEVDLSNNRLSGAWNLSAFKNVDTFNCNYNNITSIDLGKLTHGLSVFCRNNKLKKVQASYCYNLSELDCRGNKGVKVYMHSDDNECRDWRFGKKAKVYYRYHL